MGIGVPVFYLYHHLRQNSYFNNFKSVIELGSQDITVDREHISQLLEHLFGYTLTQETPVTAKILYQSMGLELHQCIDADGRHNALVFDLNKDIQQVYGFTEQFALLRSVPLFYEYPQFMCSGRTDDSCTANPRVFKSRTV